MSKKLENCKVLVKSFSGSKFRSMKDHMKQSVIEKVDHTILLVGANDSNNDRPPNLIAESTVNLAITLKKNSKNVSVFNSIMCNNNFYDKTMEVTGFLKQFCIEKNIFLIDHTNTIDSKNINRSKLHLGKSGSSILSKTFVKTISSILH